MHAPDKLVIAHPDFACKSAAGAAAFADRSPHRALLQERLMTAEAKVAELTRQLQELKVSKVRIACRRQT